MSSKFLLTKVSVVDKFTDITENKLNESGHFITLAIMYIERNSKNMDDLDKLYLINQIILVKNSNILPTYPIEYNEGFKFKSYIKNLVLEKYGIKNKYIHAIKLISDDKNYHNYLVLVDNNSLKKIHFDSNRNDSKYHFYKRGFMHMYSPNNINPNNREIYGDIYNNLKYERQFNLTNYIFKDEYGNNNVDMVSIFKILYNIG